MTEKELLYELMNKTLEQSFIFDQANWHNGLDKVKMEYKDESLMQRLSQFLIKESKISGLLNTIVDGKATFSPPNEFANFFNKYDSYFIRTKEGLTPAMLANFHGKPTLNIDKYNQKRFEAVIPQLIEAYPLMFIAKLIKEPFAQNERMQLAIEDFIQENYNNPLLFKTFEWQINPDDGIFEFIVKPVHKEHKTQIAYGDFMGYRIKEK